MMSEFELLIAAHEVNDALGLDLTPAQIVKALERHEGKRPAKVERPHYADPTATTALRNLGER